MFNTAPPEGATEQCRVMEQKETVNGLTDEPCGRNVPQNYAGLCKFVQYIICYPIKICSINLLVVRLWPK